MKKALIIGGGAAGCAAAHQLKLLDQGWQITIIEKSAKLGGGAQTSWYGGHPYTYGPRHFLTQNEAVYAYMDKHCPLRRCNEHEFWSYVPEDSEFYNFPIHQDDLTKMGAADVPHEMPETKPGNFEEFWLLSVGPTVYRKLIDGYSRKMWRIPDNRELDTFSWSPKGTPIKKGSRAAWDTAMSAYPIAPDGYNSWIKLCVEGCEVELKTECGQSGTDYLIDADIVVNTISPDELWGAEFGELPYVGRAFHKIVLPIQFALPESVYWLYDTSDRSKITRITEFKKMTRHQSPHTLLGIEIPTKSGRVYPVPMTKWQRVASRYHDLMPDNMWSLGRLGSYRYGIDIAACIEQAMQMAREVSEGGRDHPVPLERFR